MDSELQRISQLIREKAFAQAEADAFAQAEADLRAYVKQNPQSPQAFYLLSYACDLPRERLAAIRRARKLAPENERITARFRKLESGRDTNWKVDGISPGAVPGVCCPCCWSCCWR